MGGTRFGGLKAKETNKKLYGDDFYTTIARLGGKAKIKKGFANMSPEKHAEASARGGKNGKRGPKNG